jgi:glycosyltransferase involved in cell wall biosynthesis
MMRAGDKLASYEILAEALSEIAGLPWALDVVGDGEARSRVEALFERVGDRVRFHGQLDDRETLGSLYTGADLLLWPAVNEAYGMVLLEAQAHGCAVVAGSFGGVPSVVHHGETGLLTRPGDPADFARAVSELLMDGERRRQLGASAFRFVRGSRGLDTAAERIRVALSALIADHPSP